MNDLDAIEQRIRLDRTHIEDLGAQIYTAGHRNLKDREHLIYVIREQEAQLTALLDLANVSGRRGWRINADDIRTVLGAK